MRRWSTSCVLAALLHTSAMTHAQSLEGSRVSLNRQEEQARVHDFSYMQTATRVGRFSSAGYLVEIRGNADYDLYDVSYPYARPAVKLFVERLSSQFRAACGEKLTVTSLTRPINEQPRNASDQSVHPTGMAVDLRVPQTTSCRGWLEGVLLSLEGKGVVEATREHYPPHYHVAVFPGPYEEYVASLLQSRRTDVEYVVKRGDSLAAIARATGTTVAALTAENGLKGSVIHPGDKLRVPSGAAETYRVKPGDSLYTIARLYNTSVAALAAANDLRDELILAGQVLLITTQ